MSPIEDYEAEDTLLVSDPKQLRALATQPRHAILSLLRESARSISELASEMEVPKGTVGHHVKVLEDVGLIRVVGTRRVRALTEKYYGRVARLFLFQGEEAPDAVPPLGAATLRQAAQEVEHATLTDFGLVRARLAPADARRFERRLKRLVDDFRAKDSGEGTLVSLVVATWYSEPPVRSLRPHGGLWGHSDFLKLWTGQSISEFGSQISGLAIPWLAAVELHASPFEFSLLGVLGFLPFILFALPAGVWVDRLRRKPILIVGDAARAVLLAAIPLFWALDLLEMWHLFVILFVVGIFTVFFDVAYQSYLPSLVDREHLVEGNAKLQTTVSTAQVAGPSLAGAMIAAITAPYAIVVDAASFVVSTAFMIPIRRPEVLPQRSEGAPKPKMLPELKEGLAFVLRHPHLRAIASCTGSSNFFGAIGFTIALLYFVRTLHLSSFEAGSVFAVFGAGSIVGALVANPVQRAIGVGRAIVLPALLFPAFSFSVPLAPKGFPLPVLVAGALIGGYSQVAYNITQVSLRQAITPERLQGRMNASMRWIVWGTLPLGQLAGGAIASAYGLRTALWVSAIGSVFTFLPVLLSPVRSIGEMPAPITPPTPAQAEMAGGMVEPAPVVTEPGPAAADA